jgi:hypothetical protein
MVLLGSSAPQARRVWCPVRRASAEAAGRDEPGGLARVDSGGRSAQLPSSCGIYGRAGIGSRSLAGMGHQSIPLAAQIYDEPGRPLATT